ncbi:MAG: hypothetical protein KatS3mg008_2241 [Acidimicrobiales bacterium]|nr:MAG: hypothetical protein KatS3mg008_2241 [Acidimicrobiales bacterium]
MRRVSILLALVLACGCASSRTDRPQRESAGTGTTSTSAPVELFAGTVDDFYRPPTDLRPASPGTPIRIQVVSSDRATRTIRVMYHSRDVRGVDRVVTGLITHPLGEPPPGGWPVISWAHGTTGLVSKCAPSRTGDRPPSYGVEGVSVATDYIGLGPVGEIHPYLSKTAEGHAVLDIVRAAGLLPQVGAGRRWVSVGHSQGGHAAMAAAELWREYAPELRLAGTVALAPGSDFLRTFGPLDEIVTRVVGAMMLYGALGEHPDLRPEDFAGPQLAAVADVMREECLDGIIREVALLPADTFWRKDPRGDPQTRALLVQNDVGDVKVDAPLLLVGGTRDERVVIERVRSLFRRVCRAGQVTRFVVVDDANHGEIVQKTAGEVSDWIRERLEGRPVDRDDCRPRR